MRTLYILRHAKSSWADPGLDDHDRPLNARGQDACARLVPFLRREGVTPDFVLCSTALRARSTLHGIFAALPVPLTVRYDPAAYLATPHELLALLRALPPGIERPMLVGHNPGLEDLAGLLAATGPEEQLARMREKFPTGAMACLSFDIAAWDRLAPGGGRLNLFAVPRLLQD